MGLKRGEIVNFSDHLRPSPRVERASEATMIVGVLLFIALVLAAVFLAPSANAATRTVSTGQTIQSVINASTTVAGDVVVVPASTRNESIVLNKSITVQAQGAVTLRPGGSRGVDIQCSNCGVDGFRFENFEQAAATNAGVNRSNVTLRNLTFRNAGAGIWVQGTGWTLERIDMEFRCRSGEDYINAFGSNHTFRRLYLWGLRIPDDIGPRSDGTYKHSDLIQSWTAGGMVGIQNSLIEECIFTDFAEGVYFHNETGAANAINGNIVRNNVFWGTDFASQAGTNLVGGPVHTTRFTGPSSSPGTIKNNIYHNTVLGITTDRVSGVLVEGNIIDNSGAAFGVQNMTASQINKGTLGNIYWNNNYDGGVSGTTLNPQLQNPNAVGAAVIGPDGIPWTSDDAWRPMNQAAQAHGPQVGAAPVPVNVAPVANAGADFPVVLSAGSTTGVVTLIGSGTDADGTIAAYVWTGTPDPQDIARPQVTVGVGVHTFTLVVRDDKGLASAADSVTVTVSSAPAPPTEALTPAQIQKVQDLINQAIAPVQSTASGAAASAAAADAKATAATTKATEVEGRVVVLEGKKYWTDMEILELVADKLSPP